MLFVLEEKFAQAVCFLLVDLYLLTFQPEKALHLLTVLDKLSVQGSNKNGKAEVPHFKRSRLSRKPGHLFILILLSVTATFYHALLLLKTKST